MSHDKSVPGKNIRLFLIIQSLFCHIFMGPRHTDYICKCRCCSTKQCQVSGIEVPVERAVSVSSELSIERSSRASSVEKSNVEYMVFRLVRVWCSGSGSGSEAAPPPLQVGCTQVALPA